MIDPVFAAIGQTLMGLLLSLMAIFMILLILVQRGRGGGLAGALGGMGGSSAFGAKAGDVFTKVTAYSAIVWIALCIGASRMGASSGGSRLDVEGPGEGDGVGATLTAPPGSSEEDGAAATEGTADDGSGAGAAAGGEQQESPSDSSDGEQTPE